MPYQRRVLQILSLLVTIACGNYASAAYEYRYTFGSPNYTVLPGQVVAVQVYLQEKVTSGSIPRFTSPNQGLFGGGVRVSFDNAPIPTDRAEVLSTANILKNPLFTDPTTTLNLVSGSSAGLVAAVNFPTDSLIPGTPLDATTSRILLGTFNFTAGLVGNEVTHLLASDFDLSMPQNQNLAANSLTFDTVELDSLILTGTATITTIPEPSSLALLGLVGTALAGWQVRRLRSKCS